MRIHNLCECSQCGYKHEKTIRIDWRGRIHVPKPKNALLQLAEPKCVQEMWRYNGTNIKRSWENQSSRSSTWTPDEWINDLFLARRIPIIQITDEREWKLYHLLTNRIYYYHTQLRATPLETLLRLIRNMFPSTLPCPESVIYPIIHESWYHAHMHGYIEHCVQGATAYPIQRITTTRINRELHICLKLMETQGETASMILAREIIPSQWKGWSTSASSFLVIQKIGEHGHARAAELILQRMAEETKQIDDPTFIKLVQFSLDALYPIESVRPLIEQVRTRVRI